MSYDPTVWKSGDTITSAKLNKLEQGVADAQGGGGGGGGMVVKISGSDTLTMDKTFGEIMTAVTTMPISFYISAQQGSGVAVTIPTLMGVNDVSAGKEVLLQLEGDVFPFTALTDNDYPSWSE